MVHPSDRRRHGGIGPLPIIIGVVLLGALASLAIVTPVYRPQAVVQPVTYAKLPL